MLWLPEIGHPQKKNSTKGAHAWKFGLTCGLCDPNLDQSGLRQIQTPTVVPQPPHRAPSSICLPVGPGPPSTSAINVAQPAARFGHNSFPGLHHLPLSFLSHLFWGIFLGQCKHFASEMSLILKLLPPTLPTRAPLVVFVFCYLFSFAKFNFSVTL